MYGKFAVEHPRCRAEGPQHEAADGCGPVLLVFSIRGLYYLLLNLAHDLQGTSLLVGYGGDAGG